MKAIRGYINSYEEAILIIHAIRLKELPLITQRLLPEEREAIDSGLVFCFIENNNGMKRWTDGRIWSPSKISGEFLVYQEVPKHLSKNSLKKRKSSQEAINDSEFISKIEDFVDKTTLHKKTVSIDFEGITYHIIAYYRPIFVNMTFMDIDFFQKLSEALNLFPELKSDGFLAETIEKDKNFLEKFKLFKYKPEFSLMDSSKRAVLEEIACEVLTFLISKRKDISNRKI